MSTHIYFSPHLDDAALSCGGQIVQLVRDGHRVHVVTVFAGDAIPEAAVSPHVQELHARWHLDPDNPSPGRRAEDLAAFKTIDYAGDAGIQVAHLMFPDCVYRLGKMGWPIYFFRDAIFGDVAEVEAPLVDEIADAIERLGLPHEATVYLPLTAGHHVDHSLVRAAGEHWVKSLTSNLQPPIKYYEEYPYAEKPEEVTRALSTEASRALRAQLIELDQAALAVKVKAITRYRSQISTFFKNDDEMAARVRAYANVVGAGRPAERLWF